jgi:N-acylneuraminate cytidylyltransferase
MSNVCIIPARGGSKRIPRKNIRDFCGKPIIAYSIEAAIQSNLFEEVMVSTDDAEIEKIALKFGAKVPFLRSLKNADDFATTVDVLTEVIGQYKSAGKEYNTLCCCYPTAAFVTSQKLREGYELLNIQNADAVFPVVEYSYPIQRSVMMDNDHRVSMKWPEFIHARSQDLEKSYHDAGQWYWVKIDSLLQNKSLFTKNTFGVSLGHLEVQDIDNESDWRIAEIKYEFLQSLT